MPLLKKSTRTSAIDREAGIQAAARDANLTAAEKHREQAIEASALAGVAGRKVDAIAAAKSILDDAGVRI